MNNHNQDTNLLRLNEDENLPLKKLQLWTSKQCKSTTSIIKIMVQSIYIFAEKNLSKTTHKYIQEHALYDFIKTNQFKKEFYIVIKRILKCHSTTYIHSQRL